MTDVHDGSAPFDEAGLWATDALLDALAAGVPVDEDPAAALLSAFVADLTPVTAPAAPLPPQRRPRRRLAPRTGIASIAVIGVLSTGGVAAASVNAGPTSPLFPLHQVLTGGPQLDGSQRQALEVKRKLKSAARALADGKVSRAAEDVDAAEGRLPKVKPVDGQHDLARQVSVLDEQVSAGAAPVVTTSPAAKPTPPAAKPSHAVPPHPSHPAHPTPGAPAKTPPVRVTTPPAAGGQPPVTTPAPTTPAPTTTSPAPSSPAPPSAPPSATPPDPSGTPTVIRTTRPGKGGGGKGGGPGRGVGGTPAPGSPPVPTLVPPSTAPDPVSSAGQSTPPVTVPPASPTQAP